MTIHQVILTLAPKNAVYHDSTMLLRFIGSLSAMIALSSNLVAGQRPISVRDFRNLIELSSFFGDPGVGPGSDVMSGIEELVKSHDIDPARISIGGHSYGGFMSAWLIGHDHRWTSSIVADGAVDWLATYNLSNFGNLAWARDSLGGAPSDPHVADLYRTGSPIIYATQVTTPTLILSGTSDQQVPAVESYALFHALKDSGVPVRFIALPGAEHSPCRPIQKERYFEIMVDWVLAHDVAGSLKSSLSEAR